MYNETRHPNFPPSLSISPYVNSATSGSSENSNDADTFGIEAQREAILKYGIAGRVWEAAYALIAYIDPDSLDRALEFDPPFAGNMTVPLGIIELGSGTGVVADRVAKAIFRCHGRNSFVIATDLPDVCPLLQHNLVIQEPKDRRAELEAVFVRPLAWGNLDHAKSIAREFGFDQPQAPTTSADDLLHPSRRPTHILCSDLVYFPELLGPLLRTLIHLTSPPCTPSPSPASPPIQIVISYKIRSLPKETHFWTAFGLWFSFQPVLVRHRIRSADIGIEVASPADDLVSEDSNPWRQFGADDSADRTFVFVAHRRPESLSWHVPESDTDLMGGVGAGGTLAKKGDDTFETILFMSVEIDPAK